MALDQVIDRPLTHARVKTAIYERLGRQWVRGTRLPLVPELARELSVGHSAVYKAFRELVADGILVSRPGLGTVVATHHSDSYLRSLSSSVTGTMRGKRITILSSQTTDPFITNIIAAFTEEFTLLGGSVDLLSKLKFGGSHLQRRASLSKLHEIEADAVVVINPEDYPLTIRPDQAATLITTRDAVLGPSRRCDVVSVDHTNGARLAGERLARTCESDACFIGVPLGLNTDEFDATSLTRLRGFELGYGSTVKPEHQLRCQSYSLTSGAITAARWSRLDSRPQAIFAASDELAVGFISGAAALGFEPLRDFQIIGFDRQQIGSGLPGGPLTTLEVPSSEMGRFGAELLAERFEQLDRPVRRMSLGCSLFEGATVRAAAR